jgi:hypothetical protein
VIASASSGNGDPDGCSASFFGSMFGS